MRLIARVALLASLTFIGCRDASKPPATLEASPATLALDVGETRTVTASVKQGDETSPATGATWSSSDPAVVAVSGNADGTATVQGVAVGSATLQAKFTDLVASVSVTVSSTTVTLTRLELTPATPSLAAGTKLQLTATGVFSDGSMRNLSAMATWASANATILTVSTSGEVTGVAAGTTTVTATQGGRTASLDVTVTAATLESISLTPPLPSIAVGTTQQFVATGLFSDGSTQDVSAQATWASSATATATIDAAGLATGVAEGTALMTATLGGVSGGTTLTVTAVTLTRIDLAPTGLSLAKGLTRQLVATGHFSDGSTQDLSAQAVWSSDDAAIVSVSSSGLATANVVGSALVTATLNGVAGDLLVTVTAAELAHLDVAPTLPAVARGLTQQFTATGRYTDATTQPLTDAVVWSSGTATVATVSNASGSHGLATTLVAGTTVITATSGAISGATTLTVTTATLTAIQVTPTDPSVPRGVSQQLTATGVFSDLSTLDITDQVTWTTDALGVALVSNGAADIGLLTALNVGTVTVRASQGAIVGSTDVTVTAARLDRIDVTPASPTLAKGRTQQLTATGVYSDATTQNLTASVSWSSATTTVAAVNSAGLLTAVDVGAAVVSAQSGAIVGTTTATVTAATLVSIAVTPATVSLPRGLTLQLVATGTYSDGSTQPVTSQVTWASGTVATATISNAAGSEGLLRAVDVGSSSITAELDGVTGTLSINVVAATLSRIDVTPVNPSIAKGRTQQLLATGVYSDATTQNLTTTVTWSSATPAAVTVSNASGSNGLATARDVGSSVVTASFNTVSGSSTLTVTSAALVSLAVTPASPSVAKGRTQQFIATGTFSDATIQNLTTTVTWTSGTPTNASISNAAGSQGLATANLVGTSVITAQSGTVTGTATMTVTAATLVSIAVSPASASVALGRTQQFTATGTYTDLTNADVTAEVTWTTGTVATATISNAAGSRGLATSAAQGSTTVVATAGAVSGSSALTVTAAELVSISLTAASVTVGGTTQLTATGHYTDTSSQDVTSQVTWATGDSSVATVSNAAGSQGRVTGVNAGTANISATQGAVTSSATVTVTAATLVSIAVTPLNPSVAKGHTQQLVATGTYSDSTTQPLTTQVTWASSTAAATVDVGGLATAVTEGASVISATLGAVSGSTTLTVTAPVVSSIAVSPTNPAVAKGLTLQFTAQATLSDLTTQDVTATATWASADAAASISAGGLATGVTEGSAVISATLGAVSGSTTLTVGAPVVVSIDVQPNPRTVVVGATEPLTATGTFSDGTTANVGVQATWATSDALVATVNAAGGVTGVALGSASITATVGAVSGSSAVTVAAGLSLVSSTPASGATGVSALTNVVFTFSEAVNAMTVTVQSTSGACSGSLQVSRDDFATCLGVAAPVLSAGNTVVTVTPVPALVFGTSYRYRVTTALASATGSSFPATFTLADVFTTGADTTVCPTTLLISQVYGAGGNAGATYTNDFIEIHNPTAAAISVAGWSVQYASAAGTTWATTALSGSIPAGGYYLVQQAGGTVGLPMPTANATGSIAMAAASGKVALVNSTVALTGACPTAASLIDFLNFGTSATCAGIPNTPNLSPTTAAIRLNGGNKDTGANDVDFIVATPTPRNAASAANICSRSINETDVGPGPELDYCNVQHPTSLTAQAGQPTLPVYTRVYEEGATEAAGANPAIHAQLGYGPATANPQNQSGWLWFPAAYNVQSGADDEYQATFTAPAAGDYRYTARYSFDGVNWTYCDLNGAGSNSGLSFELSALPVFTVTP